jgi:excisionase family DNA binding protein
MAERLLTVKEVADYLKVNKFTVYRLIKQRSLPAFKMRRHWRFKKRDIDRWLMQNLKFDSAETPE